MFELSSYQAVAVAAVVLILGRVVVKRIPVLNRYCIPAPVVGGLVFAILNLIGYVSGIGCITFDSTFQTFFMMVFYCTVGVTAGFRLLKTGGVQVALFLAVACILCIVQDGVGCALASVFGLDARLGLAMGSIPLVGGHGTSGSFGPELESLGVFGANTVAMASATFGLVAGSMMGGPLARARIEGKNLRPETADIQQAAATEEAGGSKIDKERFLNAAMWIAVAVGLGTVVYNFFKSQNITFPTYIGAMLVGCIFRNVTDVLHIDMDLEEIDCIGHFSLSLYLAMALMSLKLWELASLAVPMIVILLVQTVIMAIFAYFIVFNVMGRDYEAACYTTAACGFGMGATANALANVQAVNRKYGPSPRTLFVVPIVGALFIDFCNSMIIMGFLNFL